MLSLRLPNRSVHPEEFPFSWGICQNLDCLAPIEPPYQQLTLAVPGSTFTTLLCSACMPQTQPDVYPVVIQVIDAEPVLFLPEPADEEASSALRLASGPHIRPETPTPATPAAPPGGPKPRDH